MPETIIADTSCLIVLSNIKELDILHRLYGSITITLEVASEYVHELPGWIKIKTAKDKLMQLVLEMQIDKGESSSITLALEIPNSTLILDDYKARKIALHLGLTFTGTIGVIIKAKISGIIPSIKPLLRKIKQTNFRLTDEIELQALKEAGE
jgi:predicted nucleic acid-binding protein